MGLIPLTLLFCDKCQVIRVVETCVERNYEPMLTEDFIWAPDEDFLDMIDQAFLDGQIDGETMELACQWLGQNYQFFEEHNRGRI